MNITKKYLFTEAHIDNINMKKGKVDVFSTPLSMSDISTLKRKGINFFIVGVTDNGEPVLFTGEGDTSEILEYLGRSEHNFNFIFYFNGDIIKKYITLDPSSPYDWQYKITRTQLKELKIQFDRIFQEYKLPF
jgi:hypothetical protein